MTEYTRTLPIRIQGAVLTGAALILGRFIDETEWWFLLGVIAATCIGAFFYWLGARAKDKRGDSDV